MNNHLITEDDYYYEYMQMRARQCDTEKNICGHHPPDHYTGAGKRWQILYGRLQMSLQNKIMWKPCCRS